MKKFIDVRIVYAPVNGLVMKISFLSAIIIMGSSYKTMLVNYINKLHIMLWLLLTHNEKSGVCKVIQGGILKSALLCSK